MGYLEKYFWVDIIQGVLIGIVIFMLSIKGASDIMIEGFFIPVEQSNFVLLIKSLTQIISMTALGLYFISFMFDKEDKSNNNLILPYAYLLVLVFIAVRAWSVDPEQYGRWLSGIVFNTLMAVSFALKSKSKTSVRIVDILDISLFTWALIFVSFNFYYLVSGYGYETEGVRFYGITSHPNFLGVSSAICSVYYFSKLQLLDTRLKKLFYIGFFLSTLFSGLSLSRTSWLMVIFGCVSVLLTKSWFNFRKMFLLVLMIGSFLIFATYETHALVSSALFDLDSRLADNTRAAVWKLMINDFAENMLLGVGVNDFASESSVLKSFSLGGIVSGLFMLLSLTLGLSFVVKLTNKLRCNFANDNYSIVVGLTIAIITGAFFEGYLVEMGGEWVIIFLLLLTILESTSKSERWMDRAVT